MTKDEIIAMAVKAKLIFTTEDRTTPWDEKTDLTKYLIRFAKLVAENEREDCAELRNMLHGFDGKGRQEMVDAMNRALDEYQSLIRERGKHD